MQYFSFLPKRLEDPIEEDKSHLPIKIFQTHISQAKPILFHCVPHPLALANSV